MNTIRTIWTLNHVQHELPTLKAVIREKKKVRMDEARSWDIDYSFSNGRMLITVYHEKGQIELDMNELELSACLNAGGHYNVTTCAHPFYFLSFKLG